MGIVIYNHLIIYIWYWNNLIIKTSYLGYKHGSKPSKIVLALDCQRVSIGSFPQKSSGWWSKITTLTSARFSMQIICMTTVWGPDLTRWGPFHHQDGTRVALQKSPKTLKLGPQNRCYFRFPLTLPGSFRSSSRWEHHFPMWKWHNMAPWHHRSRSLPHLGQITVLKVGWVDMRTAQNSQNIVFFPPNLKHLVLQLFTIVYILKS